MTEQYAAFSAAERPLDMDVCWKITVEGWAPFMLEDETAALYWDRMIEEFQEFQFALYEGDTTIAYCNSIPVVWDGGEPSDRGWAWALESAFAAKDAGIAPNTLSAISITVARSHVGKGVSKHAITAMRQIAQKHGFGSLIAPVRPSLKSAYPLTPIDRYITWTHTDGSPFDPWLRTHWRLGARILKAAPQSMSIPASIAQWEAWAGMRFPESGTYIVPGALVPVQFDIEGDQAVYIEPNVWMQHKV